MLNKFALLEVLTGIQTMLLSKARDKDRGKRFGVYLFGCLYRS